MLKLERLTAFIYLEMDQGDATAVHKLNQNNLYDYADALWTAGSEQKL